MSSRDPDGAVHLGDPPAGAADEASASPGTDFIRTVVEQDLAEGRYSQVVTRFPPEPNGYLHIGHAKSILLNFGIAEEYGGRCHLRFDDTNPLTEEEEYAEAIKRDVRWLGFDWGEYLYHASDYFDRLYSYAERLVRRGVAYVDSQNEEEIREGRGTVTRPGTESPYRSRSVEENLDLLRRMKAGEFADGSHVLRAKIDMASPNMLLRDPLLYRIRHASHYRAGEEWCIYPMYDFAHCLEDAIEGVTHSICTLEFENNRPLYDWILDQAGFSEPRPHQYEFARGELDYTITSKRKLLRLVKQGRVAGWDDPRMPTLAGLRRRGVPPEAIRSFWRMAGVSKSESRVDVGKLEYAIRDHLNWSAPRVMAVLDPVKLVVTNWPEGRSEWLDAPCFPPDVGKEGERRVPFGRELWIERDDFSEAPPKGFRRMSPGREVRLRHAYVVRCTGVERDPGSGEIVEVRCTVDPETKGGNTPDGRSVKGTIHWVSAEHAIPAEVRLYDRLFLAADPDDAPEGEDFTRNLNPGSLVVLPGAVVEPSVADDPPERRYQFERTGYFWRDPVDSTAERPVFNRIVSLRDTWGRRVEGLLREAGLGEDGEGEEVGSDAREAERSHRAKEPVRVQTPADRISDARRAVRQSDPELATRMTRYRDELGLSLEDSDILTGSRALSDFFEEAMAVRGDAPDTAAWITNDLLRELGDRGVPELPFGGAALGRLASLVAEGRINRLAGKEVLAEMAASGADPEEVVERRGLETVDDPELLARLAADALAAWPDKVSEYREGRTGLLGFFIGKVMEKTEGRADPKQVRSLLLDELEQG